MIFKTNNLKQCIKMKKQNYQSKKVFKILQYIGDFIGIMIYYNLIHTTFIIVGFKII